MKSLPLILLLVAWATSAGAQAASDPEKTLHEQRWIIGCKPIITLGVQRYHYAAKDCEFGNVPPLTPEQEAQAVENAAQAKAQAPSTAAMAKEAEKALHEQRWLIGCKPVVAPDKYGVERYYYAAEGCEYGSIVPPLTPGQEAQAAENVKAAEAQATENAKAAEAQAIPAAHAQAEERSCSTGLFIVAACLPQTKVPFEPDAQISDNIKPRADFFDPLTDLVKANTYRCDSISAVSSFFSGGGYKLQCNHYRYKYEIADKGGNWIVTVK